MGRSLRILFIEDTEEHARMLQQHLQRGGYEVVAGRVDNRKGLEKALETNTWDVILCDYVMPKLDIHAVLEVLRQRRLDLPFIVVSGQVGEDVAVEVMRAGAHDFITKQNLQRLVPAIERGLREAENRRRGLLSDSILEESETRFHTLARVSPVGIFQADAKGRGLYVNARWCEITGLDVEQGQGDEWTHNLHPDDCDRVTAEWQAAVRKRQSYQCKYRLRRPDGTLVWVLAQAEPAPAVSRGK